MRSVIVIPARLASTRLPEKLLLDQTGKTLVQHTYESAGQASKPNDLIVATDHQRIATVVSAFGGKCVMTSADATSGTDRVAEVARKLDDVDIVVNVQADEPEISAAAIDLAISLLEESPAAPMATLATPIRSREQFNDPSCVKVVFDGTGNAMYFSRSPIPCAREWENSLLEEQPPLFYQHIGLYAYRREFLLELAKLPRCDQERVESLEQLRVLHAGHKIRVGVIGEPTIGIDTPDDYTAFVARYKARKAEK